MPPQDLDLYHIEAVVWTGETAEICRATAPDGTRVALKRLRPDKARERACVRSVYREAKMAHGLEHPNVIQMLDFLTGPPAPALVMEFFPSRNLKMRVLDRQGDRLLTYHALEIIHQMTSAVLYVHERGIIHMDIKPENFLLSEDGQLKLTDFALAAPAPKSWHRFLPRPRRIAGTRPYIAPETLLRRRPDFRTDIYSFGATLFEVMTRRPPFIAGDRDELLNMHLHQPPPWPWTYDKNLTRDINELILAMLAKDPDRRPQSMLDIHTRLQRIRLYENPPVEPPPEEPRR